MGGLGPTEITLIVVSLLVLFGAKKLPEIGKSLGKGLREFKKATQEMTDPLQNEIMQENEPIKADQEIKKPEVLKKD